MSPKQQTILLHQLAALTHLMMQTLDDLNALPETKETARKAYAPALKHAEDTLNLIFDSTDEKKYQNIAYLTDLSFKIKTLMRQNAKQ